MLVVFECTVVWQASHQLIYNNSKPDFWLKRVRTLTEFRTMSVAPYPIQCYRDSKWFEIQTDKLLPGDIVAVGARGLIFSSFRLLNACLQREWMKRQLFQLIFCWSMEVVSSTKLCCQESQHLCSKSPRRSSNQRTSLMWMGSIKLQSYLVEQKFSRLPNLVRLLVIRSLQDFHFSLSWNSFTNSDTQPRMPRYCSSHWLRNRTRATC